MIKKLIIIAITVLLAGCPETSVEWDAKEKQESDIKKIIARDDCTITEHFTFLRSLKIECPEKTYDIKY